MNRTLPFLLPPLVLILALALALTGCGTTGPSPHSALAPMPSSPSNSAPVLFMAGDSTMADKPLLPAQPERGWGMMFPQYFKSPVRIVNLALNGRSSKSFRDEGRWQPVLDQLRPGDFVIIQFGHNDEKKEDPARYTEPFGSFKDNLARYVRETRERGGRPILATAVVRRKFNSQGALEDTHGDYIVAVRQAAAELRVPLLDLEKTSRALVQKLGPELSKKMYIYCEPGEFEGSKEKNGRQDDTHFNAAGASRICDLAAAEIRSSVPELAAWLK